MKVEELAKVLHDAGREAVEKGKTVGQAHKLHVPFKWLEWDELHEDAKEGRRIQARYLLNRYDIIQISDVKCVVCGRDTPYGLSYQEPEGDLCPECWIMRDGVFEND